MRLAEMANFVAARGIPGAAHRVNLCSWRKMRGTPSGKRAGGILPGGGTGDKSGLAGAQRAGQLQRRDRTLANPAWAGDIASRALAWPR